MSGLRTPPAEPPSETVQSLLERLGSAREQLVDAQRQEAMIQVARRDHVPLSVASSTYFRIEARVARNRIILWKREVSHLERRGRAMGLSL